MSWDNSNKGPELDDDVEEQVASSSSWISDDEDDNIESSSQVELLDSVSKSPFLVSIKTLISLYLSFSPSMLMNNDKIFTKQNKRKQYATFSEKFEAIYNTNGCQIYWMSNDNMVHKDENEVYK